MIEIAVAAAALLCGALSSLPAVAGIGCATITNFTPIDLNGAEAFVVTLSSVSGQPSCGNGRFALLSTDPKYKTVVAGLLGAYFSGSEVYLNGLGTCINYSSAEDLGYVCFNGNVPC